ncbi:MAG: tetratricopeptide repeat protein [Bacteroidia bacterium]
MTVGVRISLRFFVCLLTIWATYQPVHAKQPELDSLLSILDTVRTDSQRVRLLSKLSWAVENDDPQAALIHINEAITIARKADFKLGLARVLQDKAFLLWYHSGAYDDALQANQEAYEIFEELGDDAGVANAYHTFANIVEMKGDLKSALSYHKKSLEIRKTLDDAITEAWSYTNLGVVYSKLGMFDSALYYKLEALHLYESLDERGGIAGVRNNMGIIYAEKGQPNKALENHLIALKIRKELGDKRGILDSYRNIGEVFQKQGDLNRALIYYQYALKIKLKSETRIEEAEMLHAIGQIKEIQGSLDEAEDNFSRALEIFRSMGNTIYTTDNLLGLGRIKKLRNNIPDAIEYFAEARAIQEKSGDKGGLANTDLELGQLYYLAGEPIQAQLSLQKALSTAREIGAATIIRDAHLHMAEFYAKNAQYEKAYLFKVQYEKIKDSLFQEEQSRTLGDIQMQYELIEKENQIEELNLQREINQLTRRGIFIGLAGIIILSLLTMMYFRYQIQSRANKVLEFQKQEIEIKNKELASSNNELDQFAHVVSHDLKQPIRTIANYSGLMERKFANELDVNGKSFLHFISDGVANLNELVSDLLDYSQINRQLILSEKIEISGVVSTVLYSLRKTIQDTHTQIHVDTFPAIKANQAGMIQVFSQLISNSLKFTNHPTPVIHIGYQKEGSEHIFSVRDNGIGIEKDYQEKIFNAFYRLHTTDDYPGTGMGLAIAQKIINWHKGRMWIDSSPAKGSTFFFSIPE